LFEVKTNRSSLVHLVRMRNPWGKRENRNTGNGEWTGPWSDGSPEWDSVDISVRNEWNVRIASDGEFWISLDDFSQHYHDVTFCNYAPVFGENYSAESQYSKLNIYEN